MAYVLSSPIKRKDVALTQILFLVSTLFITYLSTFMIHILVKAATGSDSLSYSKILFLNIASFFATLSISGLCFMFSGIFNRSKYSIGCGGMLSVFFILMSMMAMFGGISPSMKALSNFKYLTLITLCDNDSILDGTNMWILEIFILALVSTISYMIGLLWFKKKNLPL